MLCISRILPGGDIFSLDIKIYLYLNICAHSVAESKTRDLVIVFIVLQGIAVNMNRKKCGMFSSFRWLSPDIYHINILRNPNAVDVHWGRSSKPK